MATISEQLEEIANEFCTSYCKYPDIAKAEAEDPDLADDLLFDKYCANCPLNRL